MDDEPTPLQDTAFLHKTTPNHTQNALKALPKYFLKTRKLNVILTGIPSAKKGGISCITPYGKR